MFQKGYPLPETELRPVSFNKRQQNEEAFSRNIHGARMFHNVSQFPTRETLFPVSVFVSKMQITLICYTVGNFNKNPCMRAAAKILRARASEHSSNFCEQFERRPNFLSTFKLDGTIRYPSCSFPSLFYNLFVVLLIRLLRQESLCAPLSSTGNWSTSFSWWLDLETYVS